MCMVEIIRNRKTLQSKVNICKSDVKIGDYADSLIVICIAIYEHNRNIEDCVDGVNQQVLSFIDIMIRIQLVSREQK